MPRAASMAANSCACDCSTSSCDFALKLLCSRLLPAAHAVPKYFSSATFELKCDGLRPACAEGAEGAEAVLSPSFVELLGLSAREMRMPTQSRTPTPQSARISTSMSRTSESSVSSGRSAAPGPPPRAVRTGIRTTVQWVARAQRKTAVRVAVGRHVCLLADQQIGLQRPLHAPRREVALAKRGDGGQQCDGVVLLEALDEIPHRVRPVALRVVPSAAKRLDEPLAIAARRQPPAGRVVRATRTLPELLDL
eukprot:6033369-Prymnesium_polylepis.2